VNTPQQERTTKEGSLVKVWRYIEMKEIRIVLDDTELKNALIIKGAKTWKQFLLRK
jgi:hypothetical protein